MDLRNQSAIVTGGASGLGFATAAALCDAGARVTLLDLDEERGQAAATLPGARFAKCDVADGRAVEEAIAEAAAVNGPARVLVACAGIATPGATLRKGGAMPLDEFERVLRVNLVGTFNCVRLAAAEMRGLEPLEDGERGVIVTTASIAAFEGQIGQAAYSASKGGIAAMTLPLAREFGRYGIRVVSISPGVFETPMTLGLPERSREAVFSLKAPFPHRAGRPDEFAAMALSIINNAMLNGTVIRLDGGLRAPPIN